MSLGNNDTRRPINPSLAMLNGGGCVALVFGLVFVFGSGNDPTRGTGLVVFAGLCFVAAAIKELEARLGESDTSQ
jgi:hypothetical protein